MFTAWTAPDGRDRNTARKSNPGDRARREILTRMTVGIGFSTTRMGPRVLRAARCARSRCAFQSKAAGDYRRLSPLFSCPLLQVAVREVGAGVDGGFIVRQLMLLRRGRPASCDESFRKAKLNDGLSMRPRSMHVRVFTIRLRGRKRQG